MTLLLATDAVELFDPGPLDDAGWAEPPEAGPRWCGAGNLQLAAGLSDALASDAGGHGPYDPAKQAGGLLFLPCDACPRDGQLARIRGQLWVLSQVRLVQDPAGGGLDCWLTAVAGREDAA